MGGDVVQWEDRRDVKEENPNNTLTWCQEAWMRENSEEASQAIGRLLVSLERNFSLVRAQDWEMVGEMDGQGQKREKYGNSIVLL